MDACAWPREQLPHKQRYMVMPKKAGPREHVRCYQVCVVWVSIPRRGNQRNRCPSRRRRDSHAWRRRPAIKSLRPLKILAGGLGKWLEVGLHTLIDTSLAHAVYQKFVTPCFLKNSNVQQPCKWLLIGSPDKLRFVKDATRDVLRWPDGFTRTWFPSRHAVWFVSS